MHTNSKQITEISYDDENVYTPSTSSYNLYYETNTLEEESVQATTTTSHEHESEFYSEEEREILNKSWIFSIFEQVFAERFTKHDLLAVLKLQDHGMGKFRKDNETLHGESMIPMMVMSGPHSFTSCTDFKYHLGGHDITL